MKKRLVAMVLAAAMAATAVVGCGSSSTSSGTQSNGGSAEPATAAPEGEDVYWTVAACPASSALYPFWVSLGDCLQKEYPQYKVTVSESQGAVAITKSVNAGTANFGNSVSATDYENYNGVGTFEGHPNKDARMLFYYEVTAEMFCVTKESGITTLAGLDGKKFCPGGTGTSAEDICKKTMDLFGYKPEYFTASQSDSSDAYANREIVGTVKLGPTKDSYVMQLDAALPVNVISLSDDEIAKITEKYPYLIQVDIPANTYDDQPEEIHTVGTPQGCQANTQLSQQDGYNICKAIFDTQKAAWQAAYPVGANNDLVELTLSSTLPLHAGTVQYLQEIGVEVPENLIPEEYVPVNA